MGVAPRFDLWDLDPGVLHLNHGSFGAVPRAVVAAQHELHRRIEASPDQFFFRELRPEVDAARAEAAAFLGADPAGLTFVENATVGVNTVLESAELRPGDEVLVTDHAYGACEIAARRICRRTGARLVVQPVQLPIRDAAELAGSVLEGVTPRTRIAMVEHIASPTAVVFPIAEIVARLRERGVPVLVDAAHVPGMLDVSLEELAPDFWTGNFHKWAGSPRGAAALYVAPAHRRRTEPLVASWDLEAGYPGSFTWTGTRDWTPWLCVPVALRLLEDAGWDRLRRHNADLARRARRAVASALGMALPCPDDACEPIGMTLVALPPSVATTRVEAEALRDRVYHKLRAEVAVVAWNGRGYLRLSAQGYNTLADYEGLADGLPALLGQA